MGQEKPVTFVSYCKWWKGWFIIDFPFVTFVTFVTGKKMAQNSYVLHLLRGKRWPRIFSRYLCFFWSHYSQCIFHSLLSLHWFLHGPGKSLLRSFHIVNDERDDLSLTFPSLRLLRLLRGKRWPRIFSRYLCFFWSQDSQCIFHSLLSLHWFLHGPGKSLLRSFHIVNDERDDLSLTFPSLRLLRLLRGKRWPRIFSRYLCFFWSQDSQCIFHSLHSLRWFLHGPGKACYVRFIL